MARWPVDGRPVVMSPFRDPRREPDFPGGPLAPGPHFGIDLSGRLGDPIRAPETMVISDVFASTAPDVKANTGIPAPWSGYGPGIVVGKGKSGRFHLLAHLRTVNVAPLQRVAEGDQVGTMGVPGGAGAHVHWEVRDVAVDDGPATRAQHTVDPVLWLGSESPDGVVPASSSSPVRKADSIPTWVIVVGLLWLVTRRG